MRKRKPRAYLEKQITGRWCLELIDEWVARDYWSHEVARGKTRKECEAKCRENGYVPERG